MTEIKSDRSTSTKIVGKQSPWGGEITMEQAAAEEFDLGVVYWLEQKEPDLMRPIFRRRARVVSKTDHLNGSVTVGFIREPDPPVWSQTTDPESRQLAGLE